MNDLLKQDRQHRLIKMILDHYGASFFHKKRVLDLGAGDGGMALAISRLQPAEVVCCDARESHLANIRKKYPHLKTVCADLDKTWPFKDQQFDLVLSIDLMSHLENFEKHIADMLSVSSNIVLECETLNTLDPAVRFAVEEPAMLPENSFRGKGIVVSGRAIENRISELNARFKKINETKISSIDFKYDWTENGNWPIRKASNRKFWFIRTDALLAQKIKAHQELQKAHALALQSLPPKNPDLPNRSIIHLHDINNKQHFIHNAKQIEEKLDGKIRLFYHYYAGNPEIDYCLNKNLDNQQINTIILEDNDPTFQFFFDKINSITEPNDINIICNSHIVFDETILFANNIKHKELYALTCWDLNNTIFSNDPGSQDTWIIRGRVENVYGDFPVNRFGSDNRIAYEFHKAGYKVLNPSKSIKTYYYNSNVGRNYPSNIPIPGPHLFVIPTEFQ
jgi:SAM-dependent methyltransferase